MVSSLHAPAGDPRTSSQNSDDLRTLIDELIAEQGQLQTPAARFSEAHDREPDLSGHYRNLIPLSRPGTNEQYAFEVSLDRCTGCKACVSACHNLNGLDEHESWRDTGTLVGGEAEPGWQQTVTTACHHCESPECSHGCPVGAYEKEADTGIVRHLDDQCIGCSYCILKCPYDVPKYSKSRGIVRKCDMCHQRLAEGEAPACAQACPTEAIRIVKVPTAGTGRPLFEGASAASSLPSSAITFPTTRFIGRAIPSTAVAADRDQLVPQHPHWPLVLMLSLTQAGIGLTGSALFQESTAIPLLGALLFNAGMVAAVFHLGQPLKAWRFFIGLRTSWLSREILAFSLFAPIPLLLATLPFIPDFPSKSTIMLAAGTCALPAGLVAVFTSIMIYVDTRRSFWRLPLTATRFLATTSAFFLLGISTTHPVAGPFAAVAVAATLLPGWIILRSARPKREWSPDHHSARLMRGPLRPLTVSHLVLTATASISAILSPWLALPFLTASVIVERLLFFRAVQAPKMPGNFGPARHHASQPA